MAYIVDLRSDTVTKPTTAMKHAMVNSALGDDVYGEDPTVNTLESKVATLLGKQAALFVPSGTMANLIAVMVHCNKRGSEAFAGHLSHLYRYEQGGASHLGGVLLSTLQNKPDGTFDIAELAGRLRGSDLHEPISTMVAIENTHNVCGGKVLPLEWVDALGEVCGARGLALHMDGARLLDAAACLREPPARLVRCCDSVSLCFSKGLSAPVGSALAGSYHFIEQTKRFASSFIMRTAREWNSLPASVFPSRARRVRKMLGGGMRQVGVLAAAAVVALDEVAPTLHYSHKRARILAKTVQGLLLKSFTVDVEGQHTNIVLVRIPESSPLKADVVLQRLAQVCLAETQGDCKTNNDEGVIVKAVCFNPKTIRFTLHNDINDEALWLAIMKIIYVFKELDAANPLN